MRVNPIINWSFRQIWNFLLKNSLPFNPLYHRGYTYLGNKNDSIPNPFLRIQDNENEEPKFQPAWHANDNQEPFSRYKNALALQHSPVEVRIDQIQIKIDLKNAELLVIDEVDKKNYEFN